MRRAVKIRIAASIIFVAASLCATGRLAARLTPAAQRGFERYVQFTEQRMNAEERPGGAFLRIDTLPGAQRQAALAQLAGGKILSEQLTVPAAAAEISTPSALIHHWVGTVFIPGATLGQVLAVVQDYDHQYQYFAPEVERSKLLARSGDDFTVYMRLRQTDIVTVVLDTEYQVHYQQLDARREASRSYSTRVAEIARPGETSERALSPSEDHGFLWRINSYWRFEEISRGVFVQCEAISLTRDIPVGLGWMLAPLIDQVPKESLEFTLGATRKAALGRAAAPQQ